MLIGANVSVEEGLLGAAKEAASYGGNVFMIYTGAPQNTARRDVSEMKIEEGHAFMAANGLEGFVVHAPYIINLGSCRESTFEIGKKVLKLEIERTAAFGAQLLVLHPGAFTEMNLDFGINRVVEGLNAVLGETEQEVVVCLETMAGKGTEIGRGFDELKRIIDGVKKRVGVCFDTCHVHDAGYDIVNNLDGVMEEFDRAVGLELLKVFHINGSLNERGAKKDRHANIGAGADNPRGADCIGVEALRRLAHSKYAESKYLILETPWLNKTENLYKKEIEMLRV